MMVWLHERIGSLQALSPCTSPQFHACQQKPAENCWTCWEICCRLLWTSTERRNHKGLGGHHSSLKQIHVDASTKSLFTHVKRAAGAREKPALCNHAVKYSGKNWETATHTCSRTSANFVFSSHVKNPHLENTKSYQQAKGSAVYRILFDALLTAEKYIRLKQKLII